MRGRGGGGVHFSYPYLDFPPHCVCLGYLPKRSMRIRTARIRALTRALVTPTIAGSLARPTSGAERYACRHALTHLCAVGATPQAVALTKNLAYVYFRSELDFPEGVERWRLECRAVRLDDADTDWGRFEQQLSADVVFPLLPGSAVLQCAELVGGAPARELGRFLLDQPGTHGADWIRASRPLPRTQLGDRVASGVTHWASGSDHCWFVARNRIAFRRAGRARTAWAPLLADAVAIAAQPHTPCALVLSRAGEFCEVSVESGSIRLVSRPHISLPGAVRVAAAWGTWAVELSDGGVAWLPPGAEEWERIIPPGAGQLVAARLSVDGLWLHAQGRLREVYWRVGETCPAVAPPAEPAWQSATDLGGVRVHGQVADLAGLTTRHGVDVATVRHAVESEEGSSALGLADGRWSVVAVGARPRRIQPPCDVVDAAVLRDCGEQLVLLGRVRKQAKTKLRCCVFDAATGRRLWKSTESSARGVALEGSGGLLVQTVQGGRLRTWQLVDGVPVRERGCVDVVTRPAVPTDWRSASSFARAHERVAWAKSEVVSMAELRETEWQRSYSWTLPHHVDALEWCGDHLFASSQQTDLWVLASSGARRVGAFGWTGQASAALRAQGTSEILAWAGEDVWAFSASVQGAVDNGLDVSLLALSPDGQTVVSAQRGGGACLWRAATGKVLFKLDDPRHKLRRVMFSADGARVALGCAGLFSDRGWTVFDVGTGQPIGAVSVEDPSSHDADEVVKAELACAAGPAVSPCTGQSPVLDVSGKGANRFLRLNGLGWCAASAVRLVLPLGEHRWCVGDASGEVVFLHTAGQ